MTVNAIQSVGLAVWNMGLLAQERRGIVPQRVGGWLLPCMLVATLAVGCTCGERRPLLEDAFVVLTDAAPGSLDPRFALSDYGAKISQLIFSALVTVDTADGQPELDLAVAVEQPSPGVYEIELRRDARFHDGHPLTAEDVVYTFGQLDAVGSPLAGPFRDVTVSASSAHRVRFELPEPRPGFLLDLRLGIVPAHRLRDTASGLFDEDNAPLGSGPFAFYGRRGEHEVALVRNPDYYGGAPSLQAVSFRLIRDDNARLLATLSGSGDLVQNAISPLLLPVISRYPQLALDSAPSFKVTYIVFNVRHDVLSDVRVRRAIALAIDRGTIIEQKFGGRARLATGLLAPEHWAYSGEVARYPYDPDRADALLDDAGYPRHGPDGSRFRLVFKVSSNKFRRAVAQLIAYQLGAVGIDVEVQSYEWGTFFGDVRTGNFEMATLQWPSVTDPDHYRYVFHSESIPWQNDGRGANRGGYADARLDSLIDQARRATDLTARRELYALVQARVAEQVPYVHLWHEDNFVVRDRRVRGYQMTPNARFRYLAETRTSAGGY